MADSEREQFSSLLTESMQQAKVGNHVAAKAALDQSIDLIVAMRPNAQRWRDLANHYVVDAQDLISARKVLALGLTTMDPTSAAELCVFVLGYVRALDNEMARTVLMRAEVKATPEDWEDLFKANAAVGSLTRAEQLIHEQLAAATTLDACQKLGQLVNRWDIFDAAVTDTKPVRWNGALQRVVLARMEQLAVATTKPEQLAGNWNKVAENYRSIFGDTAQADILRCIERAAQHLYSDSARTTVAHKLRYWIGDREAADQIWPWQPPSAALPARNGQQLDGWTADRSRLFDWLRPQISDDVAGKIVGQGTMHVREENLVLNDIRDTGRLPSLPLQLLIPKAVLSGDVDVGDPGRAFASTLECFGSSPRQKLPDLVESCRPLGTEALDGAIGLLVALHEGTWDYNNELAHVRFALLLAAAARDPKDPRLAALTARVAADHDAKPLDLKNPAWHRMLEAVLAPHEQFASLASRLR